MTAEDKNRGNTEDWKWETETRGNGKANGGKTAELLDQRQLESMLAEVEVEAKEQSDLPHRRPEHVGNWQCWLSLKARAKVRLKTARRVKTVFQKQPKIGGLLSREVESEVFCGGDTAQLTAGGSTLVKTGMRRRSRDSCDLHPHPLQAF